MQGIQLQPFEDDLFLTTKVISAKGQFHLWGLKPTGKITLILHDGFIRGA